MEKDFESEESDGQEMGDLCLESCAKCGEIMEIEGIEEHTRKCVAKNSSIDTEKVDHQEQLPALLYANGLQKITHISKFLTATDGMAYANREEFGKYVNVLSKKELPFDDRGLWCSCICKTRCRSRIKTLTP